MCLCMRMCICVCVCACVYVGVCRCVCACVYNLCASICERVHGWSNPTLKIDNSRVYVYI